MMRPGTSLRDMVLDSSPGGAGSDHHDASGDDVVEPVQCGRTQALLEIMLESLTTAVQNGVEDEEYDELVESNMALCNVRKDINQDLKSTDVYWLSFMMLTESVLFNN